MSRKLLITSQVKHVNFSAKNTQKYYRTLGVEELQRDTILRYIYIDKVV